MSARILFPGKAEGPVLRLSAPLSFWGGIDPRTGRIVAVRHPEANRSVAGTILVVPSPIGSSSSSSVLLELVANGLAPAGIVLGAPDAILVVGCLVARELGHAAPPILVAEAVPHADRLRLAADGTLGAA
jgi:predicted aconitase with swiveling domain